MKNIKSIFLREFSYLTNHVGWRRWAMATNHILFIIITASYLLSSTNSPFLPNIILGSIVTVLILQLINGIVLFRNRLFQDVPQTLGYMIVLNLIDSLWTRVIITGILSTISLFLFAYIEVKYMEYFFVVMFLHMTFYNTTMRESITTFFNMRIVSEEE